MKLIYAHITTLLVIIFTIVTSEGAYGQIKRSEGYDYAIDYRYMGGNWRMPRFDFNRDFMRDLYIFTGVSSQAVNNSDLFATDKFAELQFNFGAGYRFSPVHSMELSVEKSSYWSTSASYYMNLNNIILDGDYRSSFEVFWGASVDYHTGDIGSLGMSSSFRVQYNCLSNLGIYVEPKFSAYKSTTDGGFALSGRPSIGVGVSYRFNQEGVDLVVPILLKTNLLYDLAISPNIGIEIPIGDHFSFNATVLRGWWLQENTFAWQLQAQDVSARIWFGDRNKRERLTGWFAGVMVGAGFCDFQFEDLEGVQADMYIMTGGTGGYAMRFNKSRWGAEFELGFGYLVSEYQKYRVVDNEYLVKAGYRMKFYSTLPIKANVSLTYRLFNK